MAERKEDDSKNLRTLAEELKEHEKGDNLSMVLCFQLQSGP
jgi:hypothetical protein